MRFLKAWVCFIDSEALGIIYIKSEHRLHFFLHKSRYPDGTSTVFYLRLKVIFTSYSV